MNIDLVNIFVVKVCNTQYSHRTVVSSIVWLGMTTQNRLHCRTRIDLEVWLFCLYEIVPQHIEVHHNFHHSV